MTEPIDAPTSGDNTNEDLSGTYRFAVTAIAGVEPYQPSSIMPEWANPQRGSALLRVLTTKIPDRDPAAWDPWLSEVTERWPIALAIEEATIQNTSTSDGARYEIGRELAIQVFADSQAEARTIAEQCFEAGVESKSDLFSSYTIEPFESGGVNPLVTDEFDHLAAEYGPTTGSYEPAFPELLIGPSEEGGAVAGVIRVDLSRSQLEAIIDRAREHLRTNKAGSFDLHLKLWDKETSDQLIEAFEAIHTDGEVFRIVTLADEDPAAVSLVFLCSRADAQRLLKYIDTIPQPIYENLGMPVWHRELTTYMTDRFVDLAETALERDEPGIVNGSQSKKE